MTDIDSTEHIFHSQHESQFSKKQANFFKATHWNIFTITTNFFCGKVEVDFF